MYKMVIQYNYVKIVLKICVSRFCGVCLWCY
ncbi:hypothetical protein PANI_CDS0002 [Maribacter phage Panino]